MLSHGFSREIFVWKSDSFQPSQNLHGNFSVCLSANNALKALTSFAGTGYAGPLA